MTEEFIGDDGVNWCFHAREQAYPSKTENHNNQILVDLISLLPKDFSALDVGCNIANWYLALKYIGVKNYVGVDASKEAIQLAKRRYPEATFVLSRLENITFSSEFDLVFSHTVLQHISYVNKKLIMPRLVAALKPNGLLVIEEKCDVETGTTFTIDGWIKFIEQYNMKIVAFVETVRDTIVNRFIFRKLPQ